MRNTSVRRDSSVLTCSAMRVVKYDGRKSKRQKVFGSVMSVLYLNSTSVVLQSVYAAHAVCKNRAKTTAQLQRERQ